MTKRPTQAEALESIALCVLRYGAKESQPVTIPEIVAVVLKATKLLAWEFPMEEQAAINLAAVNLTKRLIVM